MKKRDFLLTAIFLPSLPSLTSVQNLLFFVFSNFRVFVIGFHLQFAESKITRRITKARKNASIDGGQRTNQRGSPAASNWPTG